MGGVVGVILAAGKGRRMGTPKALLTWRGQTFIDHLINAQTSAGITHIVVVTIAQDGPFDVASPGPRPDANPAPAGRPRSASPEPGLSASIKHPEDLVLSAITAPATAPMLHSLHAALDHIRQPETNPAPAPQEWPTLLVGPVDQGPYPSALVAALREGFDHRAARVRIPTFEGQPGHPVLIGGGFVHLLLQDHEGGLRGIFHDHPDALEHIPLPHAAIPRNLNTRDQYDAFLAAHP